MGCLLRNTARDIQVDMPTYGIDLGRSVECIYYHISQAIRFEKEAPRL